LEHNHGVIHHESLDHAGSAGGVVLTVDQLTLGVHVLAADEHTERANTVTAKVVGGDICASAVSQLNIASSSQLDNRTVEDVVCNTSRVDQVLGGSACVGHTIDALDGTKPVGSSSRCHKFLQI
jgi:hypothetical protein